MLANLSGATFDCCVFSRQSWKPAAFSAAQIELQCQPIDHQHAHDRAGASARPAAVPAWPIRLQPDREGAADFYQPPRLFCREREFRSEAGAARGCLVGNLTVGIVDNLINNPACRLHDAITRFNARAPEVQIGVQVGSPTEIERAVLEGRFDLGFGACGRHSPYLNYDDLFEERQVLYCGRGHPLFERSAEVSYPICKGNSSRAALTLLRTSCRAVSGFPRPRSPI